MQITAQLLATTAQTTANTNMHAACTALRMCGEMAGLDDPLCFAVWNGQVLVESGRYHHVRELWGPTAAQRGYEGRSDLGNTQPGDGSKFRGFGLIQTTGRSNVTRFDTWARELFDAPDFVETPALIALPPWSGLSAIWYWHVGNPTGKSLNHYARDGNLEMVTRRINGGLTHYRERIEGFTRTALALLGGDGSDDVREFQGQHKLDVDNIAGPNTRAALVRELINMPALGFGEPVDTAARTGQVSPDRAFIEELHAQLTEYLRQP